MSGLINFYDENRRPINISALGLTGLRLVIPAPSYKYTIEEMDGYSGGVVTDATLQQRKLKLVCFTTAKDYGDSLRVRDRLFGMVGTGRPFYISEVHNPLKHWKVFMEEWEPERLDNRHYIFEIPLIAESGHAESITAIEKSYTTPTFVYKNEGTMVIDPVRYPETEIKFVGASTNLIIRNKTSGVEWSWTGTTEENDVILLKGIRCMKNDVSILGPSNKKAITIKPGSNEFEVVGATGPFKLTIKSRFYFL